MQWRKRYHQAILVSCEVPWDDREQLLEDVFRLEVRQTLARGFNDLYADKVLVLVDGRSVYSPSFSGVYWDSLDIPLEDIERIEVLNPAAAALYGDGAANGAIIITTLRGRGAGLRLDARADTRMNRATEPFPLNYRRTGVSPSTGEWSGVTS